MSRILVIAEHEDGKLKLATLSAVSFARSVAAQSGGSFQILALGENLASISGSLCNFGAAALMVADHPRLKSPLADKYAHVIASVVRHEGFDMVVGAASTFSKDILPRAAALLDAAMLSDVVEAKLDGTDFIFKRVMFAGNAIATVKLDGPIRFFTVRAAAFAHSPQSAEASPVVPVAIDEASLPSGSEHVARETKVGGRPDSTEARVVVSGGRAIKNAEDFERLIGGLADALGGAVGSSRALVDAGVTPNSLQVGQTGKIVAPDLYIAVGISGAIQHLAGMKDTKVIVGINKDADAPIFEVADFGLVGDAYQVVPELVAKLKI
jgi:electron transfer flavoprotein alpha subunit